VAPRLKKKYGQHHLVDGRLCRPLLEFLEPQGRRVIEIGPGGGILTRELLDAGARVWAWEVDLEWAAELHRRGFCDVSPDRPQGALSLVVQDALEIPWGHLPGPTLAAGNLPYNVATAILEKLLPHGRRVPRAAFLVQKEVADRLVASPGDAAYGALSVLTAAWSEARILARVRRGSFRPPPKVEGAFVGLALHEPPLPPEAMPGWQRTVRLAFGQRRKQLKNSLAAGWGREVAEGSLAAAGIPATARAEELSFEDFCALHRRYQEVLGVVGRKC
jgi:16S rRNA (adenine1518-N6/adenine1519-N6)-dimethyltransferase